MKFSVGFGWVASLVWMASAAASVAPAEFRASCAKMAREGLPERMATDWNDIDAVGAGESQLKYELPVVFHVINHEPGFLGMGATQMDEGNVNDQLELIRIAFNPCGIAVVPAEVKFWEAPEWFDTLAGNDENEHYLGDEERCLFRAVNRPRHVNVYFVEGITGHHGASHAFFSGFLNEEVAGDRDFVGAVVIGDNERAGFASNQEKRTVVAHEIGHVVLNFAYTPGPNYNLLASYVDYRALTLTARQCEEARHSPFVRRR